MRRPHAVSISEMANARTIDTKTVLNSNRLIEGLPNAPTWLMGDNPREARHGDPNLCDQPECVSALHDPSFP